MSSALPQRFVCIHSRARLEREIEMAEEIESEKGWSQHIESYASAIRFVLGQQGSEIREEYEELMEQKANGEAA